MDTRSPELMNPGVDRGEPGDRLRPSWWVWTPPISSSAAMSTPPADTDPTPADATRAVVHGRVSACRCSAVVVEQDHGQPVVRVIGDLTRLDPDGLAEALAGVPGGAGVVLDLSAVRLFGPAAATALQTLTGTGWGTRVRWEVVARRPLRRAILGAGIDIGCHATVESARQAASHGASGPLTRASGVRGPLTP